MNICSCLLFFPGNCFCKLHILFLISSIFSNAHHHEMYRRKLFIRTVKIRIMVSDRSGQRPGHSAHQKKRKHAEQQLLFPASHADCHDQKSNQKNCLRHPDSHSQHSQNTCDCRISCLTGQLFCLPCFPSKVNARTQKRKQTYRCIMPRHPYIDDRIQKTQHDQQKTSVNIRCLTCQFPHKHQCRIHAHKPQKMRSPVQIRDSQLSCCPKHPV